MRWAQRYLRRGSDVCILTYGVITKMAAEIAEAYRTKGKSVSLVSCPTPALTRAAPVMCRM